MEPTVGGEQSLTIRVAEEGSYIAISHVWSHGMGNERENALPTCQLLRLRKYVSDLSKAQGLDSVPHIWIDTLCIPVDPNLQSSRRLAITQLPRTFDETDHVLVVDAELQMSSLSSSMMEIGLRILCSTWMRRLWTLAEVITAIFSIPRGSNLVYNPLPDEPEKRPRHS